MDLGSPPLLRPKCVRRRRRMQLPRPKRLGHPSTNSTLFMELGPTTPRQALTVDVVDDFVKQMQIFPSLSFPWFSSLQTRPDCYGTRTTGPQGGRRTG
ncbi:hypothetical protein QBC45DRAFT_427142 [Copromyces sp. CBS 386.78]|nr:hypothetical protein QBC45DRAFT_427142 [Copromyces sp. CBS 386.78]